MTRRPWPGYVGDGAAWVDVRCQHGPCTLDVWAGTDLRTGGGVTHGDCLHRYAPGHRQGHVGMMGRPHPPVSARGRHGGRVQRARRRQARTLAAWMADRPGAARWELRGAR